MLVTKPPLVLGEEWNAPVNVVQDCVLHVVSGFVKGEQTSEIGVSSQRSRPEGFPQSGRSPENQRFSSFSWLELGLAVSVRVSLVYIPGLPSPATTLHLKSQR